MIPSQKHLKPITNNQRKGITTIKIEGNKEPKQEETQISKRGKANSQRKEKEKEKPEPPIIALNIPLLNPKDPQPGKAEVIVNVLKLAEEKYGWG